MIMLTNLSPTVSLGLCLSAAKIDYDRFVANGRAYIRLTHPSFVPSTLDRLKKTTINAHTISAVSCADPTGLDAQRTRGTKGREEAAKRGSFTGNGPGGMINSNGTDVVLYGLPLRLDSLDLKQWLFESELVPEAPSGKPACESYKVFT